MDDVAECERELARALELAIETGDVGLEASVRRDLGDTLSVRARVRPAVGSSEAAIEWAEQQHMSRMARPHFRYREAWALLKLGRLAESLRAVDLGLADEPLGTRHGFSISLARRRRRRPATSLPRRPTSRRRGIRMRHPTRRSAVRTSRRCEPSSPLPSIAMSTCCGSSKTAFATWSSRPSTSITSRPAGGSRSLASPRWPIRLRRPWQRAMTRGSIARAWFLANSSNCYMGSGETVTTVAFKTLARPTDTTH